MASTDKLLAWLHGEVKTPPFSKQAHSRAMCCRCLIRSQMPRVGARCHELRVRDAQKNWRIIYRTDSDAIVIAAVWNKTTRTTPDSVIDQAKRRLRLYEEATG
jgi:phage-related protein